MNKREPYVTSPYLGLQLHRKSFPVSSTDYLDKNSSSVAMAGEFFQLTNGALTRPTPAADSYTTYDGSTLAKAVDGNPIVHANLYMLLNDVILDSTDVKYRQQLEVLIGPYPVRFKVAVYEHSGWTPAVGEPITVGALTAADKDGTTGKVGLTKYDTTKGGGTIFGHVVAVPDSEGMLEVELITPQPGLQMIIS